jgi:HK97 family phage portal protein
MNIFSKLFSRKTIKSADSINGSTFYSLTGDNFGFNPYNFGKGSSREFLENAYGGNPYVFAVIDRICTLGASIPRKVISMNNEELENPNPAIAQLIAQPNERESFKELLYKAGASYLSTGECFFVKTTAIGFNEPNELIVPTNTNVTINQNQFGMVLNYSISYFGVTRTVAKEDVLHLFKPDVTADELHGLSALRAGRKVYKADNEIWSNEANLHKNAGISGILTPEAGGPPLGTKEQDNLQDYWNKNASGSKTRGQIRVQNVPMKYLELGMNLKDLQSVQGRLDHLRAICSLYSVPSQLFGDTAASTYNNVREMKASLYTNAVLPLYSDILFELSKWLIPSGTEQIKLLEDTIQELQISMEEKRKGIIEEVNAGILSREQALAILHPEIEIVEPVVASTEGAEGDVLEEDPAAMDANAQAQANLRGSVGGVQGILSIQASFAQGLTSAESAISILMEIYGFEENVARQILGL